MKNSRTLLVSLLVVPLFLLSGCSSSSHSATLEQKPETSQSAPSPASPQQNASISQYTASNMPTWNETTAPNYYQETGQAQNITLTTSCGYANYSPLDSLGRTQKVNACVTKEFSEHGSQPSANPSGWLKSNPNVDIVLDTGKTYHGDMYNRSHMLAKSLGGQGIVTNLVTGTRTQNVGDNNSQNSGGMAHMEYECREYLKIHPEGDIYYNVTPVYEGNELIPRWNVVDVQTVDKTINKQVIVFNTAKGYTINYMDGQFTKN